jgi:citrate lyase subunit beta/citryl-CoA lyase
MTPLTWLYAPAVRPDLMRKAYAAGADAVIVDLEDAVLPAMKDKGRRAAIDFLDICAGAPGPALYVRVNSVTTVTGRADLRALAGHSALKGVRLPKVEGTEEVRHARQLLGGSAAPGLHCLVESARGLEHCAAIAGTPGVSGISLGEGDLAAELGWSEEESFTWARPRLVVAAAAAGLPAPSMSAYVVIDDDEGLAVSCRRGQSLGLRGRAAIHPRQLPVIERAFAPSPEEVARARAVLDEAERAEAAGIGAFRLPGGAFADRPIVEAARRTLDSAARVPIRPAAQAAEISGAS